MRQLFLNFSDNLFQVPLGAEKEAALKDVLPELERQGFVDFFEHTHGHTEKTRDEFQKTSAGTGQCQI
jgi:hypothetical protein